MKKQIMSLALAALIILTQCPTVYAADEFAIENGVLIKYNGYGGNVTIPESVTEIGDDAFAHCEALTGVTIPNSVTMIGNGAFLSCTKLTNVTIPNSVTMIGNGAFAYCYGLTGIAIPNSVKSIEGDSFAYCTGLMNLTVDSSNKNYTSMEGVIFSKDKTVIVAYPAGRKGEIEIPDNTATIGEKAFVGCTGLTRVIIPISVETIGKYAFAECRNLTSVNIPNSVITIGDCAFWGASFIDIAIPGSVTRIGRSVFGSCIQLMGISVDASNKNYTSVDGVLYSKDKTALVAYPAGREGAFVVPNSVVTIEAEAFVNCIELTSIAIPSSVLAIGSRAFETCIGLTGITISNGVTSIGDGAFNSCGVLTSITLPNSVTTIGKGVFGGCSGLTSVTLPNSIATIEDDTFNNCKGLMSITIPNSVTTIGNQAFVWCDSLTSITIPNSVITIGENAFNGCSGLTSITIPSSVTTIGDGALYMCSPSLTIYGVVGSYAETYAKELLINFTEGMPPLSLDSASEWARAGIASAIAKGFVPMDIQGNYSSVITRQEFCRIAIGFVEYTLAKGIDDILVERGLHRSTNAFADTTDPYVLSAFALGITYGTKAPTDTAPGLFMPNGQFSRQEAATMLMRIYLAIPMFMYDLYDIDANYPQAFEFADLSAADSWAYDGINFVGAHNIMGGVSTTTPIFDPRGTFTRQESIVTFDRIW